MDGAFGAGEWCGERRGGGEVFVQLHVVMNDHAVKLHGESRPGGAGAGGIKLRRDELHVVGLPRERRQAHVQTRFRDGIEAAAFVLLAFEAKGVEHLRLPASAVIHAAVAAMLTASDRERPRATGL
jgi:hypothetical protein